MVRTGPKKLFIQNAPYDLHSLYSKTLWNVVEFSVRFESKNEKWYRYGCPYAELCTKWLSGIQVFWSYDG